MQMPSTEHTEKDTEPRRETLSFDPNKMAALNPAGFPPQLNELSGEIIAAAIEVHSFLGPGLREKFYEAALAAELERRGIPVVRQQCFRVMYKGVDLGTQTIDLVVVSKIIVETKSVAAVDDIDHAQLVGYLRFTHLSLGLLLNFNCVRLKDGITRKINWPPASHNPHLTITTFPSVAPCPSP